jgi:hypothetical protein
MLENMNKLKEKRPSDLKESLRREAEGAKGRSCLFLEFDGTAIARKVGKLEVLNDETQNLEGKIGEHGEMKWS